MQNGNGNRQSGASPQNKVPANLRLTAIVAIAVIVVTVLMVVDFAPLLFMMLIFGIGGILMALFLGQGLGI